MRCVPAADAKPLHWVGSAKRDFLSFPAPVKDDMGNAPPSGIRTARRDVDLVEQRLRRAQRDYEEHYGKTTQ